MTELHELSALTTAAAVRARSVSSVELVTHALARLERLDPKVGAFTTVHAELALAQAREADRLVTRGGELPPLLGVPTAIKDLQLTAGIRTTLGSAVYADFVPLIDDHVVTRLRAAGTISLGKTTTPEFGLPCYSEPDVAAPARTPWDTSHSAGGSSGGAAAAVAAGIIAVAQGGDGGGSVRIPASVCGLVGLKVTRGRISNGPLRGEVSGLAWNGPLARTVADCAALLDAMAGPMLGDPYWAAAPPESFLTTLGSPPGRLRIGRYAEPVIAEASLHPDCRDAWESASVLLAELGHDVEDIARPFGPELTPLFETLWSVGAASVPVDGGREGELRPLTRWLRERGRAASALDLAGAISAVQAAARTAITATAAYDAVLVPTLAAPPVPLGFFRDDADPAAEFEAMKRWTPFTAPYNVTGQPAISLPLHWSDEGLPIGVMLVGRPADEATLLQLAAQLEAARPWSHRLPPVW